MARRETYQDVIDRDRDRAEPAAESGRRGDGRGEPPHARRDYRRRRALNAELGRYYEQCRADGRGRSETERRAKSRCAAVAWTRVKRSGHFPDYPTFRRQQEETADMKTPPRDSKGRFRKRSSTGNRSTSRRSGEARRRAAAPASAARETRRAPSRRSSSRGRSHQARSYESKRSSSSSRRSPARRSSGRRPQQTNIAIVPVGAMRETGRRAPRRMRARDGSRTQVTMTASGIALMFTSATVGFVLADVIDRYIAGVDPAASPAPTLPAPYTVDNPIPKYNNDAQAMQPGWQRLGAQFLLAAFGIALGAGLKSPALKFVFYGIGMGAMTHLSSQIITAYIIVPMVKSSTGTGARMYQHEMNVLNALANPSGGILGKGPAQLEAGAQRRADAPPQLPANQPRGRVPAALASQPTPVPVGTAAAAPAARPQAAAAPAPAQAAAPAAAAAAAAPAPTMGQPPAAAAHPSGCRCQQCPQEAPAPAPASNGAHPMFSYKFRHATSQRRAA